MLSWPDKLFKLDADLLRHTVVYFGMAATAFQLIRFGFWVINRGQAKKVEEGKGEEKAKVTPDPPREDESKKDK